MKLGARIAALIESGAPTRPELAAKIVELGRARGVELAAATVESRLADFQADDLAAVKYFFDDPVRARFLLEAIGVDEEDREAYRLAAAALIAPEQRGVRLVIDLSNGPQGDDLTRVVGALSTAVIDRAPPRVALVATESQRRWLPREALSPERVRLEYVRDAEQAWGRVAELAREGAVVLSSRRFPEMARWIAVEWKRGAEPFRLEPDGAIARLADGRPLDAPCPDGDARRWSSQSMKSVTPTPVVAETSMARADGITRARFSRMAATETPGRYGSRSTFVSTTRPALRNMTGYFSGLSTPSVTDSTTTLAAWPRS